MNTTDARDLLGTDTEVTARTGHGNFVQGRGRIVAYSLAPQVLIEAADGSAFWWRMDMTNVEENA